MTSRKQIFVYLIACIATAVLSGCGATSIPSPAFEEQVFDAETGAPLEGANVVAIWELREQNIHGTTFKQIADIRETVTDKDGRFSIPAVTIKNPERYVLSHNPLILIFKPGYKVVTVLRNCKDGKCPSVAIVGAAGQTFRIIKIHRRYYSLNPNPQKVENFLEPIDVPSVMGDVLATCSFQQIPRFVEMMLQEKARLESLNFKIEAGRFPGREALQEKSKYCSPGAPSK